jgi:uncharacterized protein YcfJ
MIIPLSLSVLGALAGGFTAHRRKGNGFDIAQWAVVWAILGGLVGMVLLVLVSRA